MTDHARHRHTLLFMAGWLAGALTLASTAAAAYTVVYRSLKGR